MTTHRLALGALAFTIARAMALQPVHVLLDCSSAPAEARPGDSLLLVTTFAFPLIPR